MTPQATEWGGQPSEEEMKKIGPRISEPVFYPNLYSFAYLEHPFISKGI